MSYEHNADTTAADPKSTRQSTDPAAGTSDSSPSTIEIERKFLVSRLPENIEDYPHKTYTQGYLCTHPVVRVRQEGDSFVLTYKGRGFLAREEHNLPLTGEAFHHLLAKADGRIIQKERYFIPLDSQQNTAAPNSTGSSQAPDGLTIELDRFQGSLAPLILAEVEFPSEEAARAFTPPDWFGQDVTFDGHYHNSTLSQYGLPSSPQPG